MRWALATTCVIAAGTTAAAQGLLLDGATVHPVSGPAFEGPVAVEGNRIKAVGDEAVAFARQAGVQRVDLTGRHLYPGLIDADTVLGLVEVNSVKGTVDVQEYGRINPNLRAEVAVNPDSELLPVARSGGVLLAHVAARTGIVSGTSALMATAGWTFEDMTVRAPVYLHVRWPRMQVARGGDAKPAKEQVEAREEALRLLDEAFEDAGAYWKARTTPGATLPEEDVQWDAMRRVLSGEVGVAIVADRLEQLRAGLAWGRRHNLRLAVIGGADAWRMADELALLDVPVILGPTTDLPQRDYERNEVQYENAARLHAAGVRFAFSTGGDGYAAANSRNLRRKAAVAIGYGLPEAAALHALTLGAAGILGVDERLGSIEADKDATLIVTDKPLFDPRSRVTHAWIAGRAVDLRDRQLELYERYQARPKRR